MPDRFDAGRALRRTVGRKSHAAWKPAPSREDPVAVIERSNRGRVTELVPIRHWRMMQSPFAFYRGSAAIMAADLATTPASGPVVQACGDAHLANFGAYATPERNFVFDLNDFDETLHAPWEWDLKRLATSFVLAARNNGATDRDARAAATAAARTYRLSMRALASMTALDIWYSRIDAEDIIKNPQAARRRTVDRIFPKMTEIVDGKLRLIDAPPLIYHPVAGELLCVVNDSKQLIERYRKSLRDDIRTLFDRYTLIDTAVKVVGIGSVGTICGIALLTAGPGDALLIQIKQAIASVLEPFAGPSKYKNHAERAVTGQRRLQAATDIFLGWTSDDEGHDYYFRQLRDMKASVDVTGISSSDMIAYANLCGRTLARAHARTGDPSAIGGYLGTGDAFDRALGSFSMRYADQTEADFKLFLATVKSGRLAVENDGTGEVYTPR